MSEPASERPQMERRHADRRAEPDATRRAPEPSRWARLMGIAGRDVLIILACVAAIVFCVHRARPIFSGQPTVAQSIAKAGRVAKAVLPPTPADTSKLAQMMTSPQFAKDSAAFAADL